MKKSETLLNNKPKTFHESFEARASFSRKRCISDARNYRRLPRCEQDKGKRIIDKRLFFVREDHQQEIIQPECEQSPNAEKLLPVNYFQRSEERAEQQQSPSLALQNSIYLSKMKNMRRMRLNEGISLYSPERASAAVEDITVEEQRGLNRFTNIIIKRLESKCKKVSFSQFLEKKKEKEFESKFRYLLPKRSSLGEERGRKGWAGLGNFPENLQVNCNSSLLREGRQPKARFRQGQRYHSLSGLSDSLINTSLQICKLPLKH